MFNLKNLVVASGLVTVSSALQFVDPGCVICPTLVNDCNQQYGECYDFCQEPRKTFDIPACNGVSGEQQVCEYFKNECGETFGGCYSALGPIPLFSPPECPPPAAPPVARDESCQICVDRQNDCQQWYGGCYDFCAEQRKEFEVPECNGVSGKMVYCEYMKNECGKVFGGCYPEDGPIPGWAAPPCP